MVKASPVGQEEATRRSSSKHSLQVLEIFRNIPKIFRADDDDDEESPFATELANMDTEEMDVEAAVGDGPENQQTSQKWARPELKPLNPKTDRVIFQQLDVDHYNGVPMAGMPGAQVKFTTSD